MNPLLDLQILGWLLVGLGGIEVVPGLVALGYGEPAFAYFASAAVAALAGLPLALSARPTDRRMRPRDGFLVVGVGWLLASIFGALPYLLTDVLAPVDALFESVAGFTTTGSTTLTRIEDAPRGLLLWRSITQWLGGMGIIVFAIAIVPLLGIGGMQLFRAEVPGPVASKLTPRIAVTARRLWIVYAGFTAAACVTYGVLGLDPFDAVNHALTTLATGGFSTRDASIAGFASPAVEWAATGFMALAGINFVVHYRVLTGRPGRVLRDGELHYFVAVLASATLAVAWLLAASGDEAPLRRAAFQVVSIATTTGYGSADYEPWPPLARFILLQLMLLGGMAGSTAGGLKSLRALILIRTLRSAVGRTLRPRTVHPVKYAGSPVPEDVLASVGAFFTAYMGIFLAGAVVMAAAGYDVLTAASASLTALGNVGPGLGAVGPTDTFAHLPGYAKLTLCAAMLAGRLEIFTVLVLFSRAFWRR